MDFMSTSEDERERLDELDAAYFDVFLEWKRRRSLPGPTSEGAPTKPPAGAGDGR